MAKSTVAANIHQPLDVKLHLTSQIAFRCVFGVDQRTDTIHLVFRQIANARTTNNVCTRQNVFAARQPNAEDVRQRDFNRLPAYLDERTLRYRVHMAYHRG